MIHIGVYALWANDMYWWDVSYKFGKYLYIFIAMLIYCDIMWILKSV